MSAKNVEDFYPLSPMQQGMLFHSLLVPQSGVYIEQINCNIRGELDLAAFELAWQLVLSRHTILRSAFVWEGLKEPVQVVRRSVSLPVTHLDISQRTPEEQGALLNEYLDKDRRQGFDLGRAPLMRLALIQTGPQTWRFVWTHHHILLDGWSQPILFSEFLRCYEMIQHGSEPRLPQPTPYRDYIVWLSRQDRAQAEDFWRKNLEGFGASTPLVVDRPINTDKNEPGPYKESEIWLPSDATQRLRNAARRHRLTLSTLVHAAWGLLLANYNDSRDVLFGSTVSGRPVELPGSEMMVGLFINTLPVRTRVDWEETVQTWLENFQAQLAEIRQYEYSSLADIHKWSSVPASEPMFESLLVFENYPTATSAASAGGNLEIDDVRSPETTNFPLVVVAGCAGELMLKIIYDHSRFTGETIRQILSHLRCLIESFVDHPDAKLKNVSLLTSTERHQLLVEWNTNQAELPGWRTVIPWFEAVVRERGEANALVLGNERMSYTELNARANRLARYLLDHGVNRGALVAICLERSFEMVVALLAALKAGAAYLPLDPSNPRERLRFMLNDSAAPILITISALLAQIGDSGTSFPICLDLIDEQIIKLDDANPRVDLQPQDRAYVIYTSGSTGAPKGTLIAHRGLLNLAWNYIHDMRISKSSRVLQFFSFGFDGSVMEIFPALLAGSALYLVPSATLTSPADLQRALIDKHISHMAITPSLLAHLPLDGYPELETVVVGGETCNPTTARRWCGNRRFINAYGPTECAVAATWHIVDDLSDEADFVPIGRPIANVRAYILDSRLHPAPAGVPGELFIGGIGVGLGYLKRPELTNERFIQNPIPEEPGDCLYKTGDLASFLPDGNIRFLGRVDDQVKIRGFRIELGEIDALLSTHPMVMECATTLCEDGQQQPYLAVYFVPADPANPPTGAALRAHLESRLPGYMLPAVYAPIDKLPRSPSGKIDRKRLPRAGEPSRTSGGAYTPPRDPLEGRLVQIWEEILPVGRVGVRDNFFDLGGHSLLAVRLQGSIQQHFEVNLPLAAIYNDPTVDGLAKVLRAQDGKAPVSLLVPLQPDGDRTPLFFVHPSGGNVHWYIRLAELSGSDRPFYGIQAQGLFGESPLHTSIGEMAAHYVKAIRDVQPQGPYFLGSWSMGVIIAYEMACQLEEAGQTIGLLALFDQGPNLPSNEPEDQAAYLVEVFGKNIHLDLNELRQMDEEAQIQHVWQVGLQADWVLPNTTLKQFHDFIQMLSVHTQAWRRFQPRPYHGRITLFRAAIPGEGALLPRDMGWDHLAQGGVDVIDVPGDHLSMIRDPDVIELSAKLAVCLDRAVESVQIT